MTITIRKALLTAGLFLGSAGLAAAAPATATSNLNLRAGPGTGYGVVTVLPAGATVNTLGCTGSWCRVSYRGVTGYASASYLGTAGAGYRGYGAYAAAPPRVVVPPRVYVGPPMVRPRAPHWRGQRWQHRPPQWQRTYRLR